MKTDSFLVMPNYCLFRLLWFHFARCFLLLLGMIGETHEDCLLSRDVNLLFVLTSTVSLCKMFFASAGDD